MAWTIAVISLVFEALLCVAIITKVPCTFTSCQFYKISNFAFTFDLITAAVSALDQVIFIFLTILSIADTEIDWIAYMDEVAGYDKVN